MAGGIDTVKPGTDDGDGFAAAPQGAFMRGAVDAEREAAGDGNTRLGKILREAVAGTSRRFGGVAAADDGDLRGSKQCCVAMHEQ